ncbi:MAG: hypothetical protein V3R62_10930 [Acidiferrobacterales bacterium]
MNLRDVTNGVMAAESGKTPEQRRAIIRTVIILGAMALAFYLFFIIRGLL